MPRQGGEERRSNAGLPQETQAHGDCTGDLREGGQVTGHLADRDGAEACHTERAGALLVEESHVNVLDGRRGRCPRYRTYTTEIHCWGLFALPFYSKNRVFAKTGSG